MSIAFDIGDVGAISNYDDLVDSIRNWLDRGTELDTYIPTFIMLAEAYFNRELTMPNMENVVLPALSGGTFALPSDCMTVKSLTIGGDCGQALTPMSAASIAGMYNNWAGQPRAYSITGNTVTLKPASDDYPVTLTYIQKVPALSSSKPSNWMLETNPDIYLFGALAHATAYIDDPRQVAQWSALFQASVESLKAKGNRQRWGGAPRMNWGRQVV